MQWGSKGVSFTLAGACLPSWGRVWADCTRHRLGGSYVEPPSLLLDESCALSSARANRTSEEPVDSEETASARAARARDVYQRAYRSLRESQPDDKEEAVMLLESWKEFEGGLVAAAAAEGGDEAAAAAAAAELEKVQKKMPKRVKRKRPVRTEDGMEVGREGSSVHNNLPSCIRRGYIPLQDLYR